MQSSAAEIITIFILESQISHCKKNPSLDWPGQWFGSLHIRTKRRFICLATGVVANVESWDSFSKRN